FSSRRRHTISKRDWSSDVCSSDLSDERFFPEVPYLNQFRFRTAYGASGVQPGPTDALQTFTSTTVNLGKDTPGLIAAQPGNAERSEERRVGKAWRGWGEA